MKNSKRNPKSLKSLEAIHDAQENRYITFQEATDMILEAIFGYFWRETA